MSAPPPSADAFATDNEVWRDLSSYWMLGLCNNFGYIVMLSAAHDIIGKFEGHNRSFGETGAKRECHTISTGAILLADILPSLIVKMMMLFVPVWVNLRIAIAILLNVLSFLLVAFANQLWMAFLGVILTSASGGLGESTLMAYSSSFNKNVVSAWSSGTGGAGVLGSVSYASLIGLGFSPRATFLIMLIVPLTKAFCFLIVLRDPKDVPATSLTGFIDEEISDVAVDETFKEKMVYARQLLKFIFPLMLVSYFEYVINQGLLELVRPKNTFLDKHAQYRWLNVDYQIGVFVSRSLVNIIRIPQIWLMGVLQGLNVVYFLTEVLYYYTPNIWIIFTIVLWEGLLGGGAYGNTFYRMSNEIRPNKRRLAMMIAETGDTFGVLIAAFTAILLHNAICSMPLLT